MRKYVKKIVALSMTAAMLTTMFTGCGGSSSSSNASGETKLTLALWDAEQQKVMDKMLEVYKEKTGVTVETQLTTWSEYWTKLETSLTGGSAADVVWMNVLHVEEYADAGILKDLSEIGKNLDVDANFPEVLVNGYRVDDKLYAIPKDFDTNALFYNKDLFDKAGVPYPTDDWTMDDLKETAKKLKEAGLGEGNYPIAVNFNAGQTAYKATAFANGGWFYNDDFTQLGWNDSKTLEGIQPWVDLVLEGYSPTLQQMADSDPDDMFAAGKLAMYMAGDYQIAGWLQKEEIAGKFDVVRRPSFNGKRTDIINGLGYAIPEGTKNADEALKLVEWLGSKEAMDLQGEGGVVISARNESQHYFTKTHPELNLEAFLANLDDVRVLPHCKVESEVSQMASGYLQKAWTGEISLKEASDKICEEGKVILDKAYKR